MLELLHRASRFLCNDGLLYLQHSNRVNFAVAAIAQSGAESDHAGSEQILTWKPGCADGTDDFVLATDSNGRATVVACEGGWGGETPGIAAGGVALCGTGFSVCAGEPQAVALGVTSSACNCPDGMSNNNFFASLESSNGGNDCNNDSSDGSVQGTNGIWGCGCNGQSDSNPCGVMGYTLGGSNWKDWKGYQSPGTNEASVMYHSINHGADNGGIMCCTDVV